MFAQDSWKAAPEPDADRRHPLRRPDAVHAEQQRHVRGDDGEHLRPVGRGQRRHSTASATSSTRARQAARVRSTSCSRKGSEGYKTDLNNFAPSASIAWRPDVQSGFLRTLLGDPNQATLRAGYSEAYERQGLTRFTDLYGGNRGASISLSRDANTGLVPAGQTWPVLLSQTDRLYSATFNPDPTYPIAVGANRADSLNAFAPDIEIARVRNWMVGFARSISQGHGGRDPLRRQPRRQRVGVDQLQLRREQRQRLHVHPRRESRRQRVHERVQAGDGEPPGQQRLGRREPGRIVRLLRLRHRHQPAADLSRLPERQPRRRQSRRLRQRRQHLGECHHRRPARRTEPEPERGGGRSRRQPDAPEPGAGPGIRVELLRRQPGRRQRQRHRQRRVQQVQRAAARAAAAAVEGLLRQRQLPVRVRGRVAVRRLQLRPRLDRGAGDRQPDRPPRHQVPGGLDAAVRPRRTVRQRHEPGAERRGRRLEHHRRRPRPDRAAWTSATCGWSACPRTISRTCTSSTRSRTRRPASTKSGCCRKTSS